MKKTILVKGMTWGHCRTAVKSAVEELAGVESVVVDLGTGRVEVEGSNLDDSQITSAIEDAGYDVEEIN